MWIFWKNCKPAKDKGKCCNIFLAIKLFFLSAFIDVKPEHNVDLSLGKQELFYQLDKKFVYDHTIFKHFRLDLDSSAYLLKINAI